MNKRFNSTIFAILLLLGFWSRAGDWELIDSVTGLAYYDIATGPREDVYAVGYSKPGAYCLAELRRSLDSGKTWATVASVPGSGSLISTFDKVTADPAGQVFVLRTAGINTQTTVSQIWRSPAGEAGANLALAHSFPQTLHIRDIEADSHGGLFALGLVESGARIVLRGQWKGSGMTWTEVDRLDGDLTAIAIRRAGEGVLQDEIWTVGRKRKDEYPIGQFKVFFRCSKDEGNTWFTAGETEITSFEPANLALSRGGSVYVVGRNYPYAAETYRSVDGGTNWLLVDSVPGVYGTREVVVAPSGQPFTQTYYWSAGGGNTTRTSAAGDIGTWEHSDAFGVIGHGLAADARSNVFAVGWTQTGGWIRKLAASQAPELELTSSGPELRLSWPLATTGYVLQRASTLEGGADWQDVSEPPSAENGQHVHRAQALDQVGFFRLKKVSPSGFE